MSNQKTMHGRGRKTKLEAALQPIVDSGHLVDVYYTPYGKGELRCDVPYLSRAEPAKQFAIDFMYRRTRKPVAWTVRERRSDWGYDKWHSHSEHATFEDAVAEVVKRTKRYKR